MALSHSSKPTASITQNGVMHSQLKLGLKLTHHRGIGVHTSYIVENLNASDEPSHFRELMLNIPLRNDLLPTGSSCAEVIHSE